MNDLQALIDAIVKTAERWKDPEYDARLNAEQLLYNSSIRATPENVAFAINQRMPCLSVAFLGNFTELNTNVSSEGAHKICVVNRNSVPLDGLREWLFVILNGFEYVGVYEEEPDPLLVGFIEEVKSYYPSLRSAFQPFPVDIAAYSAIISLGLKEEQRHGLLGTHTGSRTPVLSRSPSYSIAVLDGRETRDEREDLAEDVLMYDGAGENNVRIIWAPEELNPDPYFESFAFFRGAYPAHNGVSGSLQMKKALLEAMDRPHAYGEGLEFLVSKGDPDWLAPCHIRWVEYESLEEVVNWVELNSGSIGHLVARAGIQHSLNVNIPKLQPGLAHRSVFKEHVDYDRIIEFLASIIV